MRMVSLLPAATEIIYALGLDDQLVGVSFECDEPPHARRDKTVVVTGRDTTSMTPGEIDEYVRGRIAAGEDLYTLRAGALTELAPDLILSQDLCRVCAVPSGQVEAALSHLGCSAEVLALDPRTLEDVLDSIMAVGERTGVRPRAETLVAGLRKRLDAVAASVAGLPRPRVAVIEWVDPPFTAGHWVPDLVVAAGGLPVAVAVGADGRSAPTTWAEIINSQPDVVIVAPCGYDLAGTLAQARVVVTRIPGIPVWAIDAGGIVVRPGPRLVSGVEAIASILHPGAVSLPPAGSVAPVSLPMPRTPPR